MALLRLPHEVLKEIFENVGPSFFHEDLKRLTVSKQWFRFALPAALKSVELSQGSLQAMVSSWDIKKPFPAVNYLESLKLELVGFEIPGSKAPYRPEPVTPEEPLEMVAINCMPIIRWEQDLRHNLTRFANIVQQCRKLRNLRIRATHAPPLSALHPLEEYLPLQAIKPIISACNLRVLILDLTVDLLMSGQERRDNCHICPAIGALLPTLEILHIRMRTICPDVLKYSDVDGALRLHEVVVNLSLIENLPGITSAAHSSRCHSPGRDLLSLKSDLCEKAKALSDFMLSPKVVKIISHQLPSFEIQSLDVLSGRIGILDEDMQWNESGKAKDDPGADTDPESEISDVSDL